MNVDRHPNRGASNRPAPQRHVTPPGESGPVVAPIASEADLPLVLVGCAEAERRGVALELIHPVPPRRLPIITGRAGLPPARPAPGYGEDEIAGLRSRALTLAGLGEIPVRWTTAVGRPAAIVERFCRDHRAAVLLFAADRRRLSTRRLRSTLASAQRLSHRAQTPIHLVCRD